MVIVGTVIFYNKNLYLDVLSWINNFMSTVGNIADTTTSYNEDTVTNCSANSASQDSNSYRWVKKFGILFKFMFSDSKMKL